ncbi:MAG: class I SAM-dependent methyltransferase [Defluviitaleaceae bacterium]|nr:class I SAM-dependent methyltransferase [Defluviitaleaceae bacterium]
MPNFTNKCPVCEHEKFDIIGQLNEKNPPVSIPDGSAIVSCNHCDLIYVSPMPHWSKEDYAKLYDATYFTHLASEENKNWLNMRENVIPKKRFEIIKSHLKTDKRKLLEVGAGEFAFMCCYMAKEGWEITAQEPGEAFHEKLQKINGLKIETSDITELEGEYSVIFADSVLEHVPDPVAYYKRLAQLLTPGGVLYTVSPNERSTYNFLLNIMAKRKGASPSYIAPYKPPYHLTGFTKKSLQILAEKSGLTLASYKKAEDYMAFHALNSGKSAALKYPLALMYSLSQRVGLGTNGEALFVKGE